MIGRAGPVNHFDLVRWARLQAAEKELRQLDAHVLLLLATYADDDAVAWPSVRTLALEAGLRVTATGNNSAVSSALTRLEEAQLIWTKQAGRGRPAKRELLFNPETLPFATAKGSDTHGEAPEPAQPFATAKGKQPEPDPPAHRETVAQPFARAKPKYQEKDQDDRSTTSTPQEPDVALRHGEGLQPPGSNKTGNSLTPTELEAFTQLVAERYPDRDVEDIRRQVERLQRAGRLEQFRPLVEADRLSEVTHDRRPACLGPTGRSGGPYIEAAPGGRRGEWQDEIESALQTCDGLTALLSDDFIQSKWCDQEVGFCVGRNIRHRPGDAGRRATRFHR